jgi:iron complex transport system substrate-binding protein
MPARLPERIICLTEETTETLYLLGEERRIAGISGFTVRPSRARREKPRVSAFTSANMARILQLSPDLVLGFSDLQAGIAADLARAGVNVHLFNQRSVQDILDMIALLAAMVGAAERGQKLVEDLERGLDAVREDAARDPAPRPKVYFEEWDEPMISGIRWVSELVGVAGGEDVFPKRAASPDARGRIVADAGEVIAARPDIIVGSWCGKKFRAEQVSARSGFGAIPAVRDGELHEIKSPLILQPGPAALTDGVRALRAIIARWHARRR